jgi:hypothetical protein
MVEPTKFKFEIELTYPFKAYYVEALFSNLDIFIIKKEAHFEEAEILVIATKQSIKELICRFIDGNIPDFSINRLCVWVPKK